MRYWMSNGDGKTYGPYTVEELRSMMASGHINDRCMLCVEGTQRWAPARTLLASMQEPASPSAPTRMPAPAPMPHRPTMYAPPSYVGPILVTLFCCVPFGLISLVYAANANVKAAQGDIVGAMADESRSRTWLMVGIVQTFAISIIYMVLVLRGALG